MFCGYEVGPLNLRVSPSHYHNCVLEPEMAFGCFREEFWGRGSRSGEWPGLRVSDCGTVTLFPYGFQQILVSRENLKTFLLCIMRVLCTFNLHYCNLFPPTPPLDYNKNLVWENVQCWLLCLNNDMHCRNCQNLLLSCNLSPSVPYF